MLLPPHKFTGTAVRVFPPEQAEGSDAGGCSRDGLYHVRQRVLPLPERPGDPARAQLQRGARPQGGAGRRLGLRVGGARPFPARRVERIWCCRFTGFGRLLG